MNYNAMLTAEKGDYRKKQDDILRKIAHDLSISIKEHRSIETTALLDFLKENPTYDYNRSFLVYTIRMNILQLAVMANDIDICKYLLSKGATPISMNVNCACRNGYIEVLELLIRNYKDASEEDIALWKQTAILNGHNNLAYLIERLLNMIYIQFSKGDTDYFIRVIKNTLKYTVGCAYMDNSPNCRPINITLQEMLESLTKNEYMPYTMEYLNVLKKIVKDSLSIYRIFHLGAEEVINEAINYHIPYKDGTKETDKRTSTGALLVVI